MLEIRIHGRGGQGNVVAAYLLADAAGRAKRHCQAFPSFGAERRGVRRDDQQNQRYHDFHANSCSGHLQGDPEDCEREKPVILIGRSR